MGHDELTTLRTLEMRRREYHLAHRDDPGEWAEPTPGSRRRVLMRVWNCVCGRRHAPWWRSTAPPSCPYGGVRVG